MATSDARTLPKKTTANLIYIRLRNSSGALVAGATIDSGLASGAGKAKLSKDGGAWANTSASVTDEGEGDYSVLLTNTECTCDHATLMLVSSDAGVLTTDLDLYFADRDIDDLAFPLTSGRGMNIEAFGAIAVQSLYADALNVAGLTTRAGTAQAGGATTITLDAGASATNDLYAGQMVVLTTSTGAGQARLITGYVGATKVATVSPAWATNPSATSTFVLVPNQTLVSALGTDAITAASLATDAVTEIVAAHFARTGFMEPTDPPSFASSFSSIVAYMLLWMIGEVDATTGAVKLRDIADANDVATHATSVSAGVFVNAAPT